MKKRILSLLLAVVMVLSLLPMGALADGEDAAPNGYVTDIKLNRSNKDTTQVDIKTEGGLPYTKYSFDPQQTSYDIVVPDAAATVTNLLTFIVTPSDTTLLGKISNGISYSKMTGFKSMGTLFALQKYCTMAAAPYEVKIHIGTGEVATGDYDTEDVYTYNFYRRATLSTLNVSYEDGTAIPVSTFDAYTTELAVEDVSFGTKKLIVSAAAFTPADTVVKYDDGTGSYVAGTDASTLELDLTKYSKASDGSITIPLMLDYQGSGSGLDGYYNLKVTFNVPADAPNGYVTDIKLNRSNKDTTQVDIKTEGGLPYTKYSFDPQQTSYDIVVPDAAATVTNLLTFIVTPSDTTLLGKISNGISYSKMTGFKSMGTIFALQKYCTMAAAPYEVKIHIGTGEVATGDYDTEDVYTYNFYRRATLSTLNVSYEDGTTIPVSTFDAFTTALNVEEVKPGTDKLIVSATAFTQADTVVKYDNGTGSYVTGKDATTLEIDLTKYSKASDGSITVPLMLDYQGSGSGLDGYYTLKVSFGEEVAVPVITAEATAEVDADKLADWKPQYSAVNGETDVTNEVVLSYYEKDGTTLLADWAAVIAYIGDAKENNTFVIKFDLADADQTVMTVTVKPVTNGMSGYVSNITVTAKNCDWTIFDSFKQDESTYSIELPILQENVKGTYSMQLTLSTDDLDTINNLRLTSSLERADGTSLVEPTTRGLYKKQVTEVFEINKFYSIGNISSMCGIMDRLSPGEYVLKLKVHDMSDAEHGDEYVFNISLLPAFRHFDVTSGAKTLPLTPPSPGNRGKANETVFSRSFEAAAPVGTSSVNIRGVTTHIERYIPTRISCGGKDITSAFNGERTEVLDGDGYTIDLTKYSKDANGVISVPIDLSFTADGCTVTNQYILRIVENGDAAWEIVKQPVGGSFEKGETVVLSVDVSGKTENLTYQWQYRKGTTLNEEEFVNIEGATTASFTVPTQHSKGRDYRCIVTDTVTGIVEKSDIVKVIVNLGKVNEPVILAQPGIYSFGSKRSPEPYRTEYKLGEEAELLQVLVGTYEQNCGILDNYANVGFEIEWYYNTEPSMDGAVLRSTEFYVNDGLSAGDIYGLFYSPDIDGDDMSSKLMGYDFNGDSLTVGDHYYYCIVYVIDKRDAENKASVVSDIAKITIVPRGEIEGFEGTGTEDDPYLVKTVDQLQRIKEIVEGGDFLSGAVFKMANDITLPADWAPIGINNGGSGKNLLAFSGLFDGDGYTMTIPDGGQPLLGYARNATVRNLKIFGKNINSSAILNNVIVDYGKDGIYQQFTDPDIITLDNVTLLSGSSTLGPGLVNDGASSGINDIIIRNCVIEEGVVVGYTKDKMNIGSFAGSINGRIENSVSYATVYGTQNVGGLAGRKGQSMGDCIFVNSAFIGNVVATGGKVGGILGAGYISDTAPNTPPVTIRNCYVVGNITGASTSENISLGYDNGGGIGGILGSEIGLRAAWDHAYITDNHFYGTITDLNSNYERVGGIAGEIASYLPDMQTYENNYYLENENYNGIGYYHADEGWKPDETAFIAKTAEEFADGTVTALLNGGAFKNWMQDENYPVISNTPVPLSLAVTGEYPTEYYIGDELDLSNAIITVTYSDGSSKTVALGDEDLSITGYDKSTRGVQTVTVKYGAAETGFDVTVLLRPTIDQTEIRVYFTLLGDTIHGEPTEETGTHTLASNNLITWIPKTSYSVDINATVLDVLTIACKANGITFTNPSGNYIDTMTYNGVKLGEFDNGNLSGWMYTLNGTHPLLGVSEQYLENGDKIVFHYTDDYTKEQGSDQWNDPIPGATDDSADKAAADKVIKTIEAIGTVTKDSGDKIKAAREAYDKLNAAQKKLVTNYDTLVAAEEAFKKLNEELPKFVDVPEDEYYTAAVAWAVENGITVGVDDTHFAPNTPCDRAQTVTFLWRAAGCPEPTGTVNPFTDVDETAYYYKAVLWAVENGITKGTSATTFSPTTTVNRAQVVTFLCRLAKGSSNGENPFTDVAESEYYAEAVNWAVENEVTKGTSSTTFSPDADCVRAQIVTFLYRYFVK